VGLITGVTWESKARLSDICEGREVVSYIEEIFLQRPTCCRHVASDKYLEKSRRRAPDRKVMSAG